MILKYEFEYLEIDNQIMAVPTGKQAEEFHGILRINEISKEILNMLSTEISEEEIISRLKKEYNAEDSVIEKAVHKFIAQLADEKLIA